MLVAGVLEVVGIGARCRGVVANNVAGGIRIAVD